MWSPQQMQSFYRIDIYDYYRREWIKIWFQLTQNLPLVLCKTSKTKHPFQRANSESWNIFPWPSKLGQVQSVPLRSTIAWEGAVTSTVRVKGTGQICMKTKSIWTLTGKISWVTGTPAPLGSWQDINSSYVVRWNPAEALSEGQVLRVDC